MTIHPTLRCDCGGQFLRPAFAYSSAPVGETPFDLGAQTYRRNYDQCSVCQHWFGRHDLDLSRLYEHDYVSATYGGTDGLRRRFDKIMALPADCSDNAQRVARVCKFALANGIDPQTGPRLLDVGAGLGVFPATAKRAGWNVRALDLDRRMTAHIEEATGVPAETVDLFKLDLAVVGLFDAITLNKVLEHVEDPVAMLERSRELLGENGFVYVEVPDVAAAVDGSGREEFFIEHHHVFSPASVAMMAQRAGFSVRSVERLREPSSKFTVAAFLMRPTALSTPR